jgi:hypothetical protein
MALDTDIISISLRFFFRYGTGASILNDGSSRPPTAACGGGLGSESPRPVLGQTAWLPAGLFGAVSSGLSSSSTRPPPDPSTSPFRFNGPAMRRDPYRSAKCCGKFSHSGAARVKAFQTGSSEGRRSQRASLRKLSISGSPSRAPATKVKIHDSVRLVPVMAPRLPSHAIAFSSPATVAMEACGSAHHWGRAIRDAGHEVRLIPPAYVKPFVKRQKNDAADARLRLP